MSNDTARGLILLAHGSRDPLWRQPIEAVASQIRNIAPAVHVRCAYLELSDPDLASSVDELAALRVTSITVMPLFLGVGRHAREDLPRLLAALQVSHANITFDLKPAIGENPQIIELMARIALS